MATSRFAQFFDFRPLLGESWCVVSATCIKISEKHSGKRRSDEVVVAVGCMYFCQICQTSDLDRFT